MSYGNTEGTKFKRGLRRDYTPAPQVTLFYLLGALHDATTRQTTYRIGSDSLNYCQLLKVGIYKLGAKAWIYQEGKNRKYWIVEFSKSLLKNLIIKSQQEKIDYIRGYFDTDGGIAKSPKIRFYIYFCQKDLNDLFEVRGYLSELGISCGQMHNPSRKIDPNYWRFYISAKSYSEFAKIIGSIHPEKSYILRMKI